MISSVHPSACASGRLLVAAAVVFANATAAVGAPTLTTLFPQAATEPTVESPATMLRLAPGTIVSLTPVRFAPRAGESQYGDTHFCGVTLDGTGPRQAVVTIGVGVTETVMCGALLAAGAVPGNRGETRRIGLIYRTGTLRSSGQTPVVLARDAATGRWSVDETATTSMDSGRRPARTIADIRRKLASTTPR